MKKKEIAIGLFGYGVVGKGVYEVLEKTPKLNAVIKKICVKDKSKKRDQPDDRFTFFPHQLLYNDEINVIVELIDDADAAFEIVKTAMENGKAVVSANKKMIAAHLQELLLLQKEHNVPFLYEAACCASIPVIRNLEEYYDNDLLQSLSGIINGSTNYILSAMGDQKMNFAEALSDAQKLGYAESDPILDISGEDAANKLVILIAHAFGIICPLRELVYKGIEKLRVPEANFAQQNGLKIKLIAHAFRLQNNNIGAFVLPAFVGENSVLGRVDDVFNGIEIEGSFADKQFFTGRGAGSIPTASAVLSDISALKYDYRYAYKKMALSETRCLSRDFLVEVYLRCDGLREDISRSFVHVKKHNHYEYGFIIVGVISFESLTSALWFHSPSVSVVILSKETNDLQAFTSTGNFTEDNALLETAGHV